MEHGTEHGHGTAFPSETGWGPFNIFAIGITVSLVQIAASIWWAHSPALAEDGLHEAMDFFPNLIFWLTLRHKYGISKSADNKLGIAQRIFFALTALVTIAGAVFAYARWDFHPVPLAVVLMALGGMIANLFQLDILSESALRDEHGEQRFWMKRHLAFDVLISAGVATAGMASWISPRFGSVIDTGAAVLIGLYMLGHAFTHSHGADGKCCHKKWKMESQIKSRSS